WRGTVSLPHPRPEDGTDAPRPAATAGGNDGNDGNMAKVEQERSLAMFVDLENLAMGFQAQRKSKFEIQKVLERLVEKGKLIVKKAYADWSRYQAYTAPFHEAGIELIEIPKRSQTGKNSADIRL